MIVSAATKYLIYPKDGFRYEAIIPLHRHKDGEKILEIFTLGLDGYEVIEEGFLTNENEFLGRSAALVHAYESGQLNHLGDDWLEYVLDSDKLMSEDLW